MTTPIGTPAQRRAGTRERSGPLPVVVDSERSGAAAGADGGRQVNGWTGRPARLWSTSRGRSAGLGFRPNESAALRALREPRLRRNLHEFVEWFPGVDKQHVRLCWNVGGRVRERTMSNQSELLDRITVRADVFGGKPIIRGMRVAVEHVLGMLAAGDTADTVLREYSELEPEDIRACLRFAHRSVAGEHVYDRLPVPEALQEHRGRPGGRQQEGARGGVGRIAGTESGATPH